jgi:FtsH-binding integral membrane protein
MAFAAAARRRPIEGATATFGVSDRVTFLRKTYAHLGGALIAFALVTAGMMKYATDLSLRLSLMGNNGMLSLLLVIVGFIVVSVVAQRLALSETSRGLQYLGLGLAVVLWSVLAQPMIWMTIVKFGNPAEIVTGDGIHAALSAKAALVLGEATIVTLAIFVGLTVTVFITKKDFTFLRGILSMSMFGLLGVVLAAAIFGFHLGMIYSAFVILLMAGYILYETSLIMNYVRPTQYVAAALLLFTSIIQLFIHVLRILAEANRR